MRKCSFTLSGVAGGGQIGCSLHRFIPKSNRDSKSETHPHRDAREFALRQFT